MTTGNDLVTGGLLNINAYSPGEPTDPAVVQIALGKLNDLLDALSNSHQFIYAQQENVLAWIPNQFKYTVGNPIGGTFTGTLVSGNPTISNVTVPSNLKIGGTLTDFSAQVPSGTKVLSFNAGAQTVTMTQNALSTVNPAETFTYTVPGDFAIDRPLKIGSSYTRITSSGGLGLDYWFDIWSLQRYNELGFKGVTGPWPKVCAYQPTFPYGILWIYPNPSQAGEVHLFTDTILTNVTLTQDINLPQGYARYLKAKLAVDLAPILRKAVSKELKDQVKEGEELIKTNNAQPVVALRFDSEIVRSQTNNAGWIMDGGFTST